MSATETSAGGLPRRRVPLLEVLSQGDLDAIHAETLKVLEQTGVLVEDGEALDIFSDGCAMVDRETHMVRLPGDVVAESVAEVYDHRDEVRGLKMVYEPAQLRFFQARFEPLA